MSALSELERAVVALNATLRRLDETLAAADLVRHDERQHLGTLRHTVVTACERLVAPAVRGQQERDRHVLAHVTSLLSNPLAGMHTMSDDRDSYDAVVSVFRYMVYEVRALQDALYRIAYELTTGNPPKRATMSSVFRSDDPVRVLLGDMAERYVKWLRGWRTVRDGVKRGRGVSIAGPHDPASSLDNYGLSLTDTGPDGGVVIDCSRATRVSDVTNALRLTNEVGQLILRDAERRLAESHTTRGD